MFGATFGYAAGWNPYAADYTRYLQPDAKPAAVGFWAALGVFWSCDAARDGRRRGRHRRQARRRARRLHQPACPRWLGKLTLLGVVLGAIARTR